MQSWPSVSSTHTSLSTRTRKTRLPAASRFSNLRCLRHGKTTVDLSRKCATKWGKSWTDRKCPWWLLLAVVVDLRLTLPNLCMLSRHLSSNSWSLVTQVGMLEIVIWMPSSNSLLSILPTKNLSSSRVRPFRRKIQLYSVLAASERTPLPLTSSSSSYSSSMPLQTKWVNFSPSQISDTMAALTAAILGRVINWICLTIQWWAMPTKTTVAICSSGAVSSNNRMKVLQGVALDLAGWCRILRRGV